MPVTVVTFLSVGCWSLLSRGAVSEGPASDLAEGQSPEGWHQRR